MKNLILLCLLFFFSLINLALASDITSVVSTSDRTEFARHGMNFGMPGEAPDCGGLISKMQIEYRTDKGLDQNKMKNKSNSVYEVEASVNYIDDNGSKHDFLYTLNYHPDRNGNNFTDCVQK